MDPTTIFQVIAVPDTGTHEQTVMLAARASVLAWHTTMNDPGWVPWWARAFTKSVRRYTRADAPKLDAIAAGNDLDCTVQATRLDDRDLVGYGFVPSRFDQLPKVVRRLRVSGLDLPRGGWELSAAGPRLAINPHLPMSTGKTAAQAAHALILHYETLDAPERDSWVAAGMPATVTEPGDYQTIPASIEIRDAGFTEIAPGSSTVKVVALR